MHNLEHYTALPDSHTLCLAAPAAGVCGERACGEAGRTEKLGRARSASCAGVACFVDA